MPGTHGYKRMKGYQAGGLVGAMTGGPTIRIAPQQLEDIQARLAQTIAQPSPDWGPALSKLAQTWMLARERDRVTDQLGQQRASDSDRRKRFVQALTGEGGGVRAALAAVPGMVDDPRLGTYLGLAEAMKGPAAPETFDVVQDPYGRGGVGQRSSLTGAITGYQGPEKPTAKWEPVTDDAGNILGQRNTATGEVKADPRTPKGAEGPQSPLAKLQADRARAVAKHGEDSTQVRQIDARIQKVTSPQPLTEFEARAKRLQELEGKTDPASEQERDSIKMDMMFGGKPPEAYVKARANLETARTALSDIYRGVEKGVAGGIGVFNPRERAQMEQSFSVLVLAFADLQNRGANFTDTEQQLIKGTIGGDPTSAINRIVKGDKLYLDRLRNTASIIEKRGQGLLDAYTKPHLEPFTYPWEEQTAAPAAVPGASIAEAPGLVGQALPAEAAQVAAAAAAEPAAAAPAAPEQAVAPGRFATMKLDDLAKVDAAALTAEEFDAFLARLTQLEGG